MANKRHVKLLTQRDILKLLRDGVYSVNIDTGTVYGRNGKELKPLPLDEYYYAVRLYDKPACKSIAIQRLVWMAGTMNVIPNNFEIHHLDCDSTNNVFSNLLCVHKIDHKKLHTDSEDIPF